MGKLLEEVRSSNRRRELEAMRDTLANAIECTRSGRDIAALMRQLQSVTKELHSLPDEDKPKSSFKKLKDRVSGGP